MTTPTLTVGQLGGLGDELGAGGQARVFELPALQLSDVPGSLVYKQYRPGRAPGNGMGRIIDLRTRLRADPAALATLDNATAWPVRQVVDEDDALLGVVLRRIPDEFLHDLRLPSGKIARNRPREVQFLFIPPDRALQGRLPTPTPTERLTICRDFAATLAFLHNTLNVVFGDINARNAVFRLVAEPTVMFVDCDAVRVVSEIAASPQLNAPDWDPPRDADVLSKASDLYKLGLFVLRCLTPGEGCSINRDPNGARGVLDIAGLDLLAAAVGGVAQNRPSAEEWHRYLRRALGESLAPPQLEQLELDRTIVAAGEPLTVRWSATEADTVTVSGVGIQDVSTSGAAGSGTLTVHPARTGRLVVTVVNNLGVDRRETGPVAVYDVPSFADFPVPMPTLPMPNLLALDLPDVGRSLPSFPTSQPVAVPPMASVVDVMADPTVIVPPEPVRLAGPPPAFGTGRSAAPIDLTQHFFAQPATDPEGDS
ncbi:hypothetical protein [Actinophytocola sediminis]